MRSIVIAFLLGSLVASLAPIAFAAARRGLEVLYPRRRDRRMTRARVAELSARVEQ